MKTLPTRILIVEDNADDEALLMRQLTKADLHTQIRVINDGSRALDYLSNAEHKTENLEGKRDSEGKRDRYIIACHLSSVILSPFPVLSPFLSYNFFCKEKQKVGNREVSLIR